MKRQIVTEGIVLSRRNYGEADRIITVLTPNHGKLTLMAKGVRRPKSRLAGGIELFTRNELTILPGRSEIQTLTSSRMAKNYPHIITDITKTMLGYELLKRLDRYMESEAGPEYFELLQSMLEGLNHDALSPDIIEFWFTMRLLCVSGHTPNTKTDAKGGVLDPAAQYMFDFDEMAFQPHAGGPYQAPHIKLLRLACSLSDPRQFTSVSGIEKYLSGVLQLSKNMVQQSI